MVLTKSNVMEDLMKTAVGKAISVFLLSISLSLLGIVQRIVPTFGQSGVSNSIPRFPVMQGKLYLFSYLCCKYIHESADTLQPIIDSF